MVNADARIFDLTVELFVKNGPYSFSKRIICHIIKQFDIMKKFSGVRSVNVMRFGVQPKIFIDFEVQLAY